MDKITHILSEIKTLEEKYRKIQENPALNGAENGFTKDELEKLNKLLDFVGEANIAADEIISNRNAQRRKIY